LTGVAGIEIAQETAPQAGLEPLTALVADELQAVNRIILQHMNSRVSLIPQLAGHIVAAGGKRLRPILTLASAQLCEYQGRRHIHLAACVEFIHTATLLHDDVVDQSNLRRGLSTANALWGNQPSVLVGDFLFSRAFQLMVADGSLKVLTILSDASAIIAEGEVQQLITSNDTATSEKDYLAVVGAKTAALFSAACRIGAVVSERPEDEEIALESYGRNFGIAFQIIDDLLDYSARQAELGKTIGDDFREGKITLPVILAFARADDSERAFWRRCLEDMEQTEPDLAHAIELMRRHGVLADTAAYARAYASDARDALAIFAASPIKQEMLELIDFCVERAY
jgi:octaprenyl-diphosphate synthase